MSEYTENEIVDTAYPSTWTNLVQQLSRMEAQIAELSKGGGHPLAAHPVGSYYWSDDPTNPEELFGGTWESVEDCFVYAAGIEAANKEIKGEKAHKLTSAESGVAAHQHGIAQTSVSAETTDHTHGLSNHTHSTINNSTYPKLVSTSGTYYRTTIKQPSSGGTTSNHQYLYNDVDGNTASFTTGGPSNNTSGGRSASHQHVLAAHSTEDSTAQDAVYSHNNMPPYIVAYCWRRTA